ncbi:MAG: amino acid permease [Planctomycetes bacterium]|nr:amino acid permease [Planctomycetota bacterium]
MSADQQRVPQDLPRTIGFLPAAGVMIGVTIGSGIYRTPADIARHVDTSWQMIAAWVVGGLLSLFGALTYAELAAMHPRSGGLYNFLFQGLGPRVSFIFGWTYMLITKPLAAAGICIVFAEYIKALAGDGYVVWMNGHVPLAGTLGTLLGDTWYHTLVVCLTLTVLTWINYLGMRLGSYVNLILTIIKIGCLLAIMVLAFTLKPSAPPTIAAASVFGVASLAPVLSAVLWTYDGWSDIGSIAGEVRDPQRNLPRIYLLGTLGLVGIYVLVNLAYAYVLPIAGMRESKAVASDVMTLVVGPRGGAVVTAFVLLSTLGATHASILTGARVTFAQAQDGLLFRFLGRVSPRYETPGVSLWVQLLMSCLCAVFFKQFDNLAGGFVFTMWIFYGLGGVAMMRLRRTAPDTPRSYRCWGYPVVPLLFIASAAGMTVLQIVDAFNAEAAPGQVPPWIQTCVFLGVLAAGWPMYDLWRWFTARKDA